MFFIFIHVEHEYLEIFQGMIISKTPCYIKTNIAIDVFVSRLRCSLSSHCSMSVGKWRPTDRSGSSPLLTNEPLRVLNSDFNEFRLVATTHCRDKNPKRV